MTFKQIKSNLTYISLVIALIVKSPYILVIRSGTDILYFLFEVLIAAVLWRLILGVLVYLYTKFLKK